MEKKTPKSKKSKDKENRIQNKKKTNKEEIRKIGELLDNISITLDIDNILSPECNNKKSKKKISKTKNI